jgi:putative transposase
MIDAFTRECLAIEADTSLSSERVVRVLEWQTELRGAPQHLRIDNGPEFRAGQAHAEWANGVVQWALSSGVSESGMVHQS